MRIWLHSDWHLWHQGIYKFTYKDELGVERRVREKFVDATEGDAYIEQRWRDLILPSDHLYNLGDCTMFRGKHMAHEFIAKMRSLPGHKRLILGNHDAYDIKVYIEAGFQKIKASNVINGILLTHYPAHPSSLNNRVKFNCHGHTHAQPDLSPLHLNVCVERTRYEPILLEEAKHLLELKQNEMHLTNPKGI